MRYKARLITGVGVWLLVLGVAWIWAAHWQDGKLLGQVVPQLWRHLWRQPREATLVLAEPVPLAVGDPIFVFDGSLQPRQVGEVVSVDAAETSSSPRRAATAVRARALLYDGAPPITNTTPVAYHTTPDSLQWVLATMLPPQKRAEIAGEMSRAFESHHDEIVAELRPIVERGLEEAMRVVEQDLEAALRRKRPQLERIGARYQREIVEKEIVPLVQNEIWPVVRKHSEPLADEIGHEVWERASLWRFGWRIMYDASPLPERRLVQQEWERFVRDEAIPVLEERTPQIITAQQRILVDVARNRKVQAAVRRNLVKILDDPELQQVVWSVMEEVVVENPRLHAVLREHWESAETQRALAIAAERLEPTVERIGELLFGSPTEGITPEFAQVLRNQILGKDRRWLVLEVNESQPAAARSGDSAELVLQVRRGPANAPSPFVTEPPLHPVRRSRIVDGNTKIPLLRESSNQVSGRTVAW